MPIGGALRVKALQPSRRRAGFAFSSNPREIAFEELGEGLAGFIRLVMICEDPFLQTVLVNGSEELPVDADVLAEMKGVLEAEKLRVDPANPPEPIIQIQTPNGSQSEPTGAAAPAEDESEKALGSARTEAVDPGRADDAAAASSENDREQADEAAADQKAASDEDHQPGATVPAPVAEPDTPASESQPAGEEIASPAAEPKQRTNTRREKAKA